MNKTNDLRLWKIIEKNLGSPTNQKNSILNIVFFIKGNKIF